MLNLSVSPVLLYVHQSLTEWSSKMKILFVWSSIIMILLWSSVVLTGCGKSQMAGPSGVTATPGNSQVTIAWAALSSATSYNIYWSTTTGVTPTNGNKIANATSPYTQTGLTNGTTYYYVVTAVNSYGESYASAQISCTPAPQPPTDVTATPGNASVTLDWTSVPDATSYNIYWSTTPGVAPGNSAQIAGVTTPYTQTGLNNGTIYYYVVTAVFATGESAASNQVSAIPAVNPTPAEPIGVTAAPWNGQVTISWTAVTGATSYNIYWSTVPGVTPGNGSLIFNATSPYTQTGLSNATTYYYVVTAVNGNGESTASTQVSATPSS